MGALPTRALYVLALTALVYVSLRPGSLFERGLDVALTPLRALAEIAAPVGLLRAGSVRAAERRAASLREEEAAEREALGNDQRRFVLPRRAPLHAGREFAIAEVTGRAEGDLDRLEVRRLDAITPSSPSFEPDMPVVVGDHYIGRVHSVFAGGERAQVDLVTRRDGFVGARIAGAARAVVGGLARDPERPETLLLDVHAPSTRLLEPGLEVEVDEGFAGDTAFAELANGFSLGRLVLLGDGGGEGGFGVRSPIDFRAGVFQVAVVTPPRPADAAEEARPQVDVLRDGRWSRARALSHGDPSGLREGLRLDAGGLRGVERGAALVAGARFLGRVSAAGPLESRARLLGDPGLTVPVVARVSGRDEPLILGTLVSLGRARQGRVVRLHWDEGWPSQLGRAAGGEHVAARLFTGAGAQGVPPGLVLGNARLPLAPGPTVVELEVDIDPRSVKRLIVRRTESAEGSRP